MFIPDRLCRSYDLLKRTRLYVSQHTDGDSLNEFRQILNDSLPMTHNEWVMYNIISGIYHEDRNKFMVFIRNTKMECFVLWCDARSVSRMLNIHRSIRIKYNNTDKTYLVGIHQPSVGQDCSLVEKSTHPLVNYLMDTYTIDPDTPTNEKKDTIIDDVSYPTIEDAQLLSCVSPGMKWGDICIV